jgi:pyocin large subunit-like protein
MRPTPKRLLPVFVIAALAAAGVLVGCSSGPAARTERAAAAGDAGRRGEAERASRPESATSARDAEASLGAVPAAGAARRDVGFRTRELLVAHWRKHGGEFGAASPEDYLRLAQVLRDAPLGGAVLERVRRDGVITRFDRRSSSFIAFERSAVIRTFFKPGDGERYFERQALREGSGR